MTKQLPAPRFQPWEADPTGRFEVDHKGYDELIDGVPKSLNWWTAGSNGSLRSEIRKEEWLTQRLWISEVLLHRTVVVDIKIRHGMPVLRGTRIGIAQIISELAEGRSTTEIAQSLDLDLASIHELLQGIAIQFDRSFIR
jgi:uncharacterized protein (DUF433 family)